MAVVLGMDIVEISWIYSKYIENMNGWRKMDKKRLDVVFKIKNDVYEHACIKGYFSYTGMYLQYLSMNRKRAEHGTIHGLLPNVCKVSSSHLKQKNALVFWLETRKVPRRHFPQIPSQPKTSKCLPACQNRSTLPGLAITILVKQLQVIFLLEMLPSTESCYTQLKRIYKKLGIQTSRKTTTNDPIGWIPCRSSARQFTSM